MKRSPGLQPRVGTGFILMGLLCLLAGAAGLGPGGGVAAAPLRAPALQTCDSLPQQDATVTPACGPVGTVFHISVSGFTPNEPLSFWITDPRGNVVGTSQPINGQHPGHLDNLPFDTGGGGFYDGVWAVTFEGGTSHHQSIARFRIGTAAGPGATDTPTTACDSLPQQDATVTPACGPVGTVFHISVSGFTPNEPLSFWITDPRGNVVGTSQPINGQHPGHLDNLPFDTGGGGFYDGVWAVTFEGGTSHHQSIARFRIGAAPGPAPTNAPTAAPTGTAVPPTTAPTEVPTLPATATTVALPTLTLPAATATATAVATLPAPPAPTVAPTEVPTLPPTQAPTVAPTAVPTLPATAVAPVLGTATPGAGGSPAPGMPRTGAGPSPEALLLLLLGLCLLCGGVRIRRARGA